MCVCVGRGARGDMRVGKEARRDVCVRGKGS